MKVSMHPKTAFLTLFLMLLCLNACQKDVVIDAAALDTPTNSEKAYPIDNITTIETEAINTHKPEKLQTRADAPATDVDIEDVVVVTSGVIINCDGNHDFCLKAYLELRRINGIEPGQRLGVASHLTLNDDSNQRNCYRYINNVGIMNFCGYIGKEKDHPLNIKNDGNYRIQVTPKHTNHNLDVFIYRHDIKNGKIDTVVVAYSNLPAGKTETLHLTKKGYYTIVVDEHGATGSGSDYILSVSPSTHIKMIPILQADNDLVYQFQLIPSFRLNPMIELTAWSFQKNINGVWTDMGAYPDNSTFSFLCSSCDYLVTPIYTHLTSGKRIEGTATLFRP